MGRTVQRVRPSAPQPLHGSGKGIHPPGIGDKSMYSLGTDGKGKKRPPAGKASRVPEDAETPSSSSSSLDSDDSTASGASPAPASAPQPPSSKKKGTVILHVCNVPTRRESEILEAEECPLWS